MPTFHVYLFEGRSIEEKRAFVDAVTRTTCESLGVEPNSVNIVIDEVKRENWGTAGKLWCDA
ncbi:4-oxalocrotonate tautomerase [Paraburkholderia flagellata]|uniref:4-oxalocrotonate tautomerase n=1 Tax=Paraburkholderia flagellata TaxID=2883241 RepID=UPI001F18E101|nr:4-oxalocrotonate tautomerase [Paraburkholderia flagellata]